MTINERIGLVISTLKMNKNSFSSRIGVNATVIHNIIKGRNAPSFEILNKISLSFDNINMNWLINEKGNMFEEIEINKVEETTEEYRTIRQPCEQCKIKDELIISLKREIVTQEQFIKHLVKSDIDQVEEGQKRKASSADYGNSKLSEAI